MSNPDAVLVSEMMTAQHSLNEDNPQPKKKAGRKFDVLSVDQLSTNSDRDCIIKPILGRGELGVIYGPPKSFKSFITLYLCWCISNGRPFFGLRVKRSRALYIACGEGKGGLGNRIRAGGKHYGEWSHDNFAAIVARVDLRDSDADLTGIIEVARDFDLIVIDTLSRALNGSDSNEDYIGRLLTNADRIREEAECYVLLVHHTGWDKSRMRGSTMIWGALDVCIRVADQQVVVEDARECESGQTFHFKAERIFLGRDSDGDEIASLAITENSGPFEGISGSDVLEVQKRLGELTETRVRVDQQSPDWWGHLIGEVLDIDTGHDDGLKRVKAIAATWLNSDSFQKEDRKLNDGKRRPCVTVGIWAVATMGN